MLRKGNETLTPSKPLYSETFHNNNVGELLEKLKIKKSTQHCFWEDGLCQCSIDRN